MVERVLQPVGRATWLAAMTHPDGEISFFNDAAFDIAPTLADVVRYADVIFAARQAQPIPAVIPAPSPVITATTAVIPAGKPESNATPVIPAGKPESNATPVIPAGKPESSAMDGKAAFNNHSAAAVRGPTVPGLGPGFPAGTTKAASFRPGRRTSRAAPWSGGQHHRPCRPKGHVAKRTPFSRSAETGILRNEAIRGPG